MSLFNKLSDRDEKLAQRIAERISEEQSREPMNLDDWNEGFLFIISLIRIIFFVLFASFLVPFFIPIFIFRWIYCIIFDKPFALFKLSGKLFDYIVFSDFIFLIRFIFFVCLVTPLSPLLIAIFIFRWIYCIIFDKPFALFKLSGKLYHFIVGSAFS